MARWTTDGAWNNRDFRDGGLWPGTNLWPGELQHRPDDYNRMVAGREICAEAPHPN